MQKFTTLTAVAAPLPMVNVDTDMLIPKQFLKTIQRTGLGKHLFDEMRYTHDGKELPDFVLNKPAYRKAQILVAGDKGFGVGQTRRGIGDGLIDGAFEERGFGATAVAEHKYPIFRRRGLILPRCAEPPE